MAPTELFARGLRWSYRKYGLKGAAAFGLLALAGYYVATRRFERLLGGDEKGGADDPLSIATGDDGSA